MSDKIAITVIAYNRTEPLKRLLNSLDACFYGDDSVPLYISIDKSETDAVESFSDAFEWRHGSKKVVKHNTNLGLKAHILEQGRLLEQHEALVVLEDDLVVAKDFWNYVKQTVAKYSDNTDVAGVSLYSFSVNYHRREPFIPQRDGNDVYFMNCAMSWGEVWMRKSWQMFERWYAENKNTPFGGHLPESIRTWSEKSWLKYHTRYCIEQNKYFVFPYVSYTTNYSEVGEHMKTEESIFQVPVLTGIIQELRLPDTVADGVCYDGFFENKMLYAALGIPETEVCLDLYRTNNNWGGKRYWLTTRLLPYKLERAYALGRRPIEQAVFDNVSGMGIFLYDTSEKSQQPLLKGNPVVLHQHFIQNGCLFLREYGVGSVVKEFLKLLKGKVL